MSDPRPTLPARPKAITSPPDEADPPLEETRTSSVAAPYSQATPPKGPTIDRYVLLDQLGEGGMGVVYKAYDPELGRLVAIKRMRAIDPKLGGASRMIREAQAVAQLAHPNVVAVHDVGEVDKDVFIAMEFVDGWRLREWLSAAPRGQREILDVFMQAARGLAAAHDRGLVHRDFKPHNVLVGYDGRVRVVDFGLARAVGEAPDDKDAVDKLSDTLLDDPLTPAGVALGTPRYMAPEQHRAQPLDGRADQFGFCVALYEALTGQTPFSARNQAELVHKVSRGLCRPFPKEAAVPRWLRRLVLRGLAASPDDRYPSMHELLDELDRDHAATRRAALGTEPHTEHMLAAFPPPDDDATLARVRELHRRLERARGRKERGQLDDARAQAEELLADLGDLDYQPLRAAVAYLTGELRFKAGDAAGARTALEIALRAAAAAGDDWQLASAWSLLVLVVGQGLRRFEEAEHLALAAELACLRVGKNPSLAARLHTSLGLCRLAAGRPAEAAAELERAVGLDQTTYGPRHWFLAVSLLHLGEAWLEAGEAEKARPALARAALICNPDAPGASPTRARCQLLAGRLALADGRRDEARRLFASAAAAFERCAGSDDRLAECQRRLAELA